MAAPTNSGEWDKAIEDFCLSLSPLLSPRWSPPRAFLPSSNSMGNQSMDNPPQNQEHDDIVDPPPYLAGDRALLQQQLRKNWSEASSDWRPRGGGIMTMNNQGFEESNMGFYFPPSPTYFPYFPLYPPMPTIFYVSSQQDISLALSFLHILEDKSGALHVIKGEEGRDILGLLFDGFESYVDNKFDDFGQIARAAGVLPKGVESLVDKINDEDMDEKEVTLRRINWLEQHDEAIIGQPVYELVAVVQQLIQNRGGELDVIFGEAAVTVNGLEIKDIQGLPTTPETLLICQAKVSFRVWLGHGGQCAAETRIRCNRLNIGSFTTVEGAISAYEVVGRWSGWMDLTGFPGLFENENRPKLPLQLPLTAQELNPVEVVGTGSEGLGDCSMADQAKLDSRCLGKRKTKEKNPGGEKRSKKKNGVRIATPLEDILQTKEMSLKDAANHLGVSQSSLKYACREYGIPRWPPRKLITQSHPTETPALVDQEGIPQSNSDTLPSDQALAATIEKITSVIVKEILPPPFLPIARQERLDEDFCNVESEAVGIGSGGGTGQSEMEEGQLNSRYLGKEKKKEMTQRGERRKKETGGVRIVISLEEILQTKEMPLKDAAKHIKEPNMLRPCSVWEHQHGDLNFPIFEDPTQIWLH
ncbi:uncharacterized protein LOC131315522 isoform X2 [Rhododendron vialii]|uniref:uncharacterized protein LOC131315522 isoform X2 n=1 Tax=Rhododendron vialii TaxID=182163 RepID=UPI00265DDC3D|nr:uncharacterized protein LOC131315522 isoform X2 [Rhododendron vialii]